MEVLVGWPFYSEIKEVVRLIFSDLEIIFWHGFLGGAKLKFGLFCNKQQFYSANQDSFDRTEKPTGLSRSLIVPFPFNFIHI